MIIVVLTLNTLGGLLLIMDQTRPEKVFNNNDIGTGLIVMNVICLVVQVIAFVVVEWSLEKHFTRRKCRKRYSRCIKVCCRKRANKKKGSTIIQPSGSETIENDVSVPIETSKSKEAKVKEEIKIDGENLRPKPKPPSTPPEGGFKLSQLKRLKSIKSHVIEASDSFESWNDGNDTNNNAKNQIQPPATVGALQRMSLIHKPVKNHEQLHAAAKKVEDAENDHKERLMLVSKHKRKLQRKTTLKTQQRRQAQIILRHSRVLAHTELFKDYNQEQIKKIIDSMELKVFAKGEYIVKENDPGNEFMVLVKGSASIYKEGHIESIATLSMDGSRVIGEATLVEDTHIRTASVVASSAIVQMLSLTRDKFKQLSNESTINSNTMNMARRMSMKIKAADSERSSGLLAGATKQPPSDSGTLRRSLIQKPVKNHEELQTTMLVSTQQTNMKTQQRRAAQTILQHTHGLSKTEIFQDFTNEQLKLVIAEMTFRLIKKGDNIVTEKEAGKEFMVIMGGSASVWKEGLGKLATLNTSTSRMIGEASLVENNHFRTASVVADTDTQVLVLTRENYNRLKQNLNERHSSLIGQKTDQRLRRLSMSMNASDAARVAANTNKDDRSQALQFEDEEEEEEEQKTEQKVEQKADEAHVQRFKSFLTKLSNKKFNELFRHVTPKDHATALDRHGLLTILKKMKIEKVKPVMDRVFVEQDQPKNQGGAVPPVLVTVVQMKEVLKNM